MKNNGFMEEDKIDKRLREYVENRVFPEYEKNEPAHQLGHIKYVIKRSLKFAERVPEVDYNIVFTVAAYHDIGHYVDPKRHEIISAEIMQKDEGLKQFFSENELKIIKEAIEDHRASSDHAPRSVYGKIVSTADRDDSVDSCLERSYFYGKKLHPEYSDRELSERAYEHLRLKFGESGYAKFFFEDEEYERFLEEIRELLSDKEKFIEMQRAYIEKITH